MKLIIIIITLLLTSCMNSMYTNNQPLVVTKTPSGYANDYPYLYILVDTVHNMSQVYNYYPKKMWISVNGKDSMLLAKKQVRTVWSSNFTLTVTRNKYKMVYKI